MSVVSFQSLFLPTPPHTHPNIRVPDYQRAYSWEPRQVDLFIADLDKYSAPGLKYYFGHFIVETPSPEETKPAVPADETQPCWEIVDGQQRLTTLVLFLQVCQILVSEEDDDETPAHDQATRHAVEPAFTLIDRFHTVSYDADALARMRTNLPRFFQALKTAEKSKPPADETLCTHLGLDPDKFTHSQKRMALALRRFYLAFEKGVRPKNAALEDLRLQRSHIPQYIRMLLQAHCSCHQTHDKAVAVHIFEMHNTRGVPLTPLEKVKAMLMKAVYNKSHALQQKQRVKDIQDHFGRIYAMEEKLAAKSFRGQMTMQQLLHLHLQVVDDGGKAQPRLHPHEQHEQAAEFHHPADNADADGLIAYIESRLHHHYLNGHKGGEKTDDEVVQYALGLAAELEGSVCIVSHTLPQWDASEPLVGDVLIQERRLSSQFFLIACRRLHMEQVLAEPHLSHELLQLWERLLFTRDLHEEYYWKSKRDDFPLLFAKLGEHLVSMTAVMLRYLENGFRSDTHGLQGIVAKHLNKHKHSILANAYRGWQEKWKYVLYKYEVSQAQKVSRDAHIRKVMKGTISLEHILPQNWQEIKAGGTQQQALQLIPQDQQEAFIRSVDDCINGLGNLLLLLPGENSSESNNHPTDKHYSDHFTWSYVQHRTNNTLWLDPTQWTRLIHERGEGIFQFMLQYFTLPALPHPSAESEHAPAA
jgi:hypothetical protein